MRKRGILGAGIMLLSSLSIIETAMAQTEQTKDQDTIVIKGQKIERSVQDTVESVAVFSATDLEDGNLNDFYELADQTANFTRNGNFEFSIRGVSSIGPAGGSSQSRTITVVQDGATLTNRATQAGVVSTWDMEQVEILRGPQSTNQGRNALAGAVILKSKDPEFVANGQAKVSVGDYGSYQLALAQTGAITDKLAFRISLDHQQEDGYIDNVITQDDAWNSSETNTLRGKLLYKADNGSEWLFTATDIKFTEDGDDNILFDPFARKAYDNYQSLRETEARTYVLEGSFPLSDQLSITSVSSLSDSNFFRDSDGDSFQTLTGDATIGQDLDEEVLSQDLRLNFTSQDLDAVIGLYFAKGEQDSLVNSNGFDFTTAFEGMMGLPSGALPAGTALLDTEGRTLEEFENYAAYFNADYRFAQDWTLITGLRVDYEERSNSGSNNIVHHDYGTETGGLLAIPQLPLGPGGALVPNPVFGATWGQILAPLNESGNDEDDFLILLPKLGIKYDITDRMNVAATYQKGYRSGGVSTNLATGATTSYDEETTDNYELSFRSQWLNNRLTLNANLFYVDWTDMQVDVRLSNGNPYDTETQNVGEAHLWGGEIESALEVTSELTMNASLGYVETEFDEFKSDPSKVGNEFGGAPDLTANLGATYRNEQGYFATGNVSHVGEAFTDETNEIARDSYTLVNVKAGYESEFWGAYVFADNLFDKDYRLSEFTTQLPNDARAYEAGAPRVVGVTANVYW